MQEYLFAERSENMKIQLKEITVREVSEGYKDSAENGVVGFGGRLRLSAECNVLVR